MGTSPAGVSAGSPSGGWVLFGHHGTRTSLGSFKLGRQVGGRRSPRFDRPQGGARQQWTLRPVHQQHLIQLGLSPDLLPDSGDSGGQWGQRWTAVDSGGRQGKLRGGEMQSPSPPRVRRGPCGSRGQTGRGRPLCRPAAVLGGVSRSPRGGLPTPTFLVGAQGHISLPRRAETAQAAAPCRRHLNCHFI